MANLKNTSIDSSLDSPFGYSNLSRSTVRVGQSFNKTREVPRSQSGFRYYLCQSSPDSRNYKDGKLSISLIRSSTWKV